MTDDDPLAGGDVQEAAGLPAAGEGDRDTAADRVELMQARVEAAVQRSFEEDSAPTFVYGSADEWLRKYWRYAYRRRVSANGQGTGRWRADWWIIDEAVRRIEALWRSWEASRLDAGLGISRDGPET
ncbi:uncharacterized protein DUF4913 [Rathayibacter sp. PhB152]|uniref:DUF4913 domain-containing protein n=1 Tax=Rathayibacter sp. PhB152 TaxID=2485190 RepID=UPI000F4BE12E|nr:DUF4913 domain-containing protein [Rathayibacter sp. PhB152]ROQ60380.1 uncharacterized protein DUF4913 [Rathayibacter sp. PhB152]